MSCSPRPVVTGSTWCLTMPARQRDALDLQSAVAEIDFAGAGLPDHLALRIGGHLVPAYAGQDPIMKQPNFFGAHVSRVARIEPVTPEGCERSRSSNTAVRRWETRTCGAGRNSCA
jgi:hypothetical protein